MVRSVAQALSLFPDLTREFPSTRYQGSKAKLADWIWDGLREIEFDSCLDAFGGTGAIAYRLKQEGKCVTYNDLLKFNAVYARALIENRDVTLSEDDVDYLLTRHRKIKYSSVVESNFSGIYFLDDENRWIDTVIQNIRAMENPYKQAIAFFALAQSCTIKRPYNLFHRCNLYIRTAEVERSFGNKATWDRPFHEWFRQFVREANVAVFDNGRDNKVLNMDAINVIGDYDLIYVDTPYISSKKTGVDYREFYHFLEGLCEYDTWDSLIDRTSKHRKLRRKRNAWSNASAIERAFKALFERFRHSTLAVSYRSDGIPSIESLRAMLSELYAQVDVHYRKGYKYVLSTNGSSDEVLFIGRNQ